MMRVRGGNVTVTYVYVCRKETTVFWCTGFGSLGFLFFSIQRSISLTTKISPVISTLFVSLSICLTNNNDALEEQFVKDPVV
jgi:hypothetical protein